MKQLLLQSSTVTNSWPVSIEFIVTVVSLIVASPLLVLLVIKIVDLKRNRLVRKNSEYLKAIKELNANTDFKKLDKNQEIIKVEFLTKKSFDNFNPKKYLASEIKKFPSNYQQAIDLINENLKLVEAYQQQFEKLKEKKAIKDGGDYKMPFKAFSTREDEFAKQLILQPNINYKVIVAWSYTTPAGRNSYSNHKDFTAKEIETILSEIKEKERKSSNISKKESNNVTSCEADDIEEVE